MYTVCSSLVNTLEALSGVSMNDVLFIVSIKAVSCSAISY